MTAESGKREKRTSARMEPALVRSMPSSRVSVRCGGIWGQPCARGEAMGEADPAATQQMPAESGKRKTRVSARMLALVRSMPRVSLRCGGIWGQPCSSPL